LPVSLVNFLEQNMARMIRRMFSSGLIFCALAGSTGLCANDASVARQATVVQTGPQVAYRPMEVRLRRLHLVRPDLIPYPIAYEIIC
jgi:hypothetical protein